METGKAVISENKKLKYSSLTELSNASEKQLSAVSPESIEYNGRYSKVYGWADVYCKLIETLYTIDQRRFKSLRGYTVVNDKSPILVDNPELAQRSMRKPVQMGSLPYYAETDISVPVMLKTLIQAYNFCRADTDSVKIEYAYDDQEIHTSEDSAVTESESDNLPTVETDVTEKQKKKAELDELISKLTQQVLILQKEQTNLQQTREQLESTLSVLSNKVADQETEYTVLQKKKAELDSDISALSQNATSLREEEKLRRQALAEIAEEHTRMTGNIQQMHDNAVELEGKINAYQDRIEKCTAWLSRYSNADENSYPVTAGRFDYSEFNSALRYAYEEQYTARFLMALHTRQIITLCGKPGTGKTTFVRSVADAIGARCTIIQVQNNWTDQADLLGYYNPINQTYQHTEFLDALICAYKDYQELDDKAPIHIICLDEMNLAHVEYYFATFLSKLQIENSKVNLNTNGISIEGLPVNGILRLPPNVRFAGTLNMDETAHYLSPKVIDRCFFIEFDDNAAARRPDYRKSGTYCPYTEFSVPDDDIIADECPTVQLWFEKENNRFISYAAQMHAACSIYGVNDDDFRDYIVLSKVLPLITRIEDYTVNRPYHTPGTHIRSNARFDARGAIDDEQWSFWG